MRDILLEACCGSADDAVEAEKAGADRVELNSSLFLGGLTPSAGELITVKRHVSIPVVVMIRPREGGFCYTDAEFETALADAEALLSAGADGIAFGFLHEDGSVDGERCRRMAGLAGSRQTVFHRAFDVVPDWRKAMDALCGMGITRILTSGQAPTAPEGAGEIADMVRYASGRIEILPGAGIRARNVADVVRRTGCSQVHTAPHRGCPDPSASGNPAIHFGGALYPPEDRFSILDGEGIRSIRSRIG